MQKENLHIGSYNIVVKEKCANIWRSEMQQSKKYKLYEHLWHCWIHNAGKHGEKEKGRVFVFCLVLPFLKESAYVSQGSSNNNYIASDTIVLQLRGESLLSPIFDRHLKIFSVILNSFKKLTKAKTHIDICHDYSIRMNSIPQHFCPISISPEIHLLWSFWTHGLALSGSEGNCRTQDAKRLSTTPCLRERLQL